MLLEGWVRFNEKQWGLRAHWVELGPAKGNAWSLRTVMYENRRGVLKTPPRNPYLPIEFTSQDGRRGSVNRRKREALEGLARVMAGFRSQGIIALDPWVEDARPFQWRGQLAEPRYTYRLELPGWKEQADKNVLQKARKAERLGYVVERSTDYLAVQNCLESVQARKGFDHRVDVAALASVADSLGPEHFVCFLARDKAGEPKGAWVRLYMPGGRALAWSAGVRTEALRDGVNNLLGVYAIQFFVEAECKSFDFVGANIPPVAAMKEAWGGRLVPNFVVYPPSFRAIGRLCQRWIQAKRK